MTPQFRHESFTFVAGPLTPKAFVCVFDHKTLGKDKVLGEGELDVRSFGHCHDVLFIESLNHRKIWRHIQHDKTSAAEAFVELREGQGLLRLRLEFDAGIDPTPSLPRGSSAASLDRSSTLGHPSRFSIRGKKVDAGKG